MRDQLNLPPLEAFERLLSGNRRFAGGAPVHGEGLDPARRAAVQDRQRPFAAVLACADSRVPPEHVFDVGLGELYVCRTAGALLDELVLGSLEHAILDRGCGLICVLAHAGCGAAEAAVSSSQTPERSTSPGFDEVARRMLPAALAAWRPGVDEQTWVDLTSRRNVELVCRQLLDRSPRLVEQHRRGLLEVVGMHYQPATGTVELVVPLVTLDGA
jgi:carbonic anhydrase